MFTKNQDRVALKLAVSLVGRQSEPIVVRKNDDRSMTNYFAPINNGLVSCRLGK